MKNKDDCFNNNKTRTGLNFSSLGPSLPRATGSWDVHLQQQTLGQKLRLLRLSGHGTKTLSSPTCPGAGKKAFVTTTLRN